MVVLNGLSLTEIYLSKIDAQTFGFDNFDVKARENFAGYKI